MKKIVSLVLCMSLFVLLIPSVFAVNEGKECISSTIYEEITDPDELIKMAIEQKAARPQTYSNVPETEMQLQVDQVLEERIYSDGTIEQEIASTTISVSDVNGIQLTADELTDYTSSSDSGYGISLYGTMFYTKRLGSTIFEPPQYRLDRMKAEVYVYSNATTTPTNGSMWYYYDYGGSEGMSLTYTGGSTQTWNKYMTYRGFHSESPAASAFPYVQTIMNLKNGRDLACQVRIMG